MLQSACEMFFHLLDSGRIRLEPSPPGGSGGLLGRADSSSGAQQQPEATAELQCLGGSAAGLLPYPDGSAEQAASPIAVVSTSS